MNDQTYRTETDFIGECHIPETAFYGIQTVRGAENFSISERTLAQEPALIQALAEIKQASARANLELSVIDAQQAQAINAACEAIIAGQYHDNFIIDMLEGSGATSINMNINEVIANLGQVLGNTSPLHPNDHVNMSQSTNDVVPAAIKIATYRMSDELLDSLKILGDAFEERSTVFAEILHLGRTCLQDAQPMTLGQVFSGYCALVRRLAQKIAAAQQTLLTLPLGGTAIGTGLGAPDGYIPVVFRHLNQLTGLPLSPSEDCFDGMQNADTFASFSGELKAAACSLSKVANDLILLSSGPNGGFGELKLPGVQAGSSIMPGKVNPVIPQMMCQIGFAVAGNDTCIAMATSQGQLEINAYEPVTASRLFDSLRLLGRGCRIFAEKCVRGIEADVRQNELNLYQSSAVSTAFVPELGYAKVAELVRQSQHQSKPFVKAASEQGLCDEAGYKNIIRESIRSR